MVAGWGCADAGRFCDLVAEDIGVGGEGDCWVEAS